MCIYIYIYIYIFFFFSRDIYIYRHRYRQAHFRGKRCSFWLSAATCYASGPDTWILPDHIYTHIHIYIYMYIYIYIHIYIYIYLFIYDPDGTKAEIQAQTISWEHVFQLSFWAPEEKHRAIQWRYQAPVSLPVKYSQNKVERDQQYGKAASRKVQGMERQDAMHMNMPSGDRGTHISYYGVPSNGGLVATVVHRHAWCCTFLCFLVISN